MIPTSASSFRRGLLSSVLFTVSLSAWAQNLAVTTITDGSSGPIHSAGIAVDIAGNLYVASDQTIFKITPTGLVRSLAGGIQGTSDGIGANAHFNYPAGIAVGASGDVYVADRLNHTIRKVTPAGAVTTIAGVAGSPGFQDGPAATAKFWEPDAVAVDPVGNVYVAVSLNQAIREVSSAGIVSTVALTANGGNPQGIALDSSGDIFVSEGIRGAPPIGDFIIPVTGQNTIDKITPAGVVTTFAGAVGVMGFADGPGTSAVFGNPVGLTVDPSGNLYVADGFLNNSIRKITPAGVVTTIAGAVGSPRLLDGLGDQARFDLPVGVAVDASGDVFVADNSGIRRGVPIANTQSPVRLVNVSTRGTVGPAAPLIVGFVVEGTVSQTVLARAVGPSLAKLGVPNGLANPQLDLYGQAQVHIASSADGQNTTDTGSAASLVGAFPLPANGGDAAMVITLQPGAYTGVVTAPNGTSGIVLLEVYEVP
jgi:hypothetical protein